MRLQNESMVYSMEYAFISIGSQLRKSLMVYVYKSENMLAAEICPKSLRNPTFLNFWNKPKYSFCNSYFHLLLNGLLYLSF